MLRKAVRRSLCASLERTHPAHVRYRALRKEMVRPKRTVHIVPTSPAAVYMEVPKAGSSTLVRMLIRSFSPGTEASYSRGVTPFPTIEEFGIRRFFALADRPDTLVFSFVRNPYSRLVSCYRSKILRHPLGRSGECNIDVQGAHDHFGKRLNRLPADEPLPFSWFVDLACETSRSTINRHWRAMSDLIPRKALACDFVGHLENFDEDIASVSALLEIPYAPLHVNASGEPANLDEWITPAMRTAIFNSYREDFERFQYSR